MHSPALNNDKDTYELSVTSEPSVPPPPLNENLSLQSSNICESSHQTDRCQDCLCSEQELSGQEDIIILQLIPHTLENIHIP